MPKIAVTGANGLVGKKLCENLATDYDLVRIDVRGVDEIVDVCDLPAFERAIAGCESLIHLARAGGGANSTWEDTQTNMAGTYNAFEAARKQGCKQVIFASSNHAVGMYEVRGAPEIYEPKNGTLLRTDIPFRADGYYGVWKAFGEVLGRYYSDEFGLRVACLRIGSVRPDAGGSAAELAQQAGSHGRTGDTWTSRGLDDEARRKRMASVYMSHADLSRLVRAVLKSDVSFGVAYGVSDNATRFWDLEAGRTLYGFWPEDSIS